MYADDCNSAIRCHLRQSAAGVWSNAFTIASWGCMICGLGATVGPLGGAWLYENLGPAAPFYANGLILAACAAVLWALLEVPRRTQVTFEDGFGQ